MNIKTHDVFDVEILNAETFDTETFLCEKTEFDINYLSSRINSTLSATLYLKKLRTRMITQTA